MPPANSRAAVVGLAVALVGATLLALRFGPLPLPVERLLAGAWDDPALTLVLGLRAPRVARAARVGAALALAGVELQALFGNPLVDPNLLGIGSGAALATALWLAGVARRLPGLLGGDGLVRAAGSGLAAFFGALVAGLAVARLGGAFRREEATARLVLAGVAVNAIAGSLTGLVLAFADDATLRAFTFWSLGSFAASNGRGILLMSCALVAVLLGIGGRARALDLLALGPREARLAGVAVEGLRRRIFLRVALVLGLSVSLVGTIGFVGLVAPHLARGLVGPGHRGVLPSSALLGALLLVVADTVARTVIVPAELPLGLVTGLLGAPFFLALLRRRGLL